MTYEGDDLAEYVIDANITRGKMSMGRGRCPRRRSSRPTADARRAAGHMVLSHNLTNPFVVAVETQRLNEAGVVLDYAPDLAPT